MLHWTDNIVIIWTYGVPLPLIKGSQPAFEGPHRPPVLLQHLSSFRIQSAFCSLLKKQGASYPPSSMTSMPVVVILYFGLQFEDTDRGFAPKCIDPALLEDDTERGAPSDRYVRQRADLARRWPGAISAMEPYQC